MFLVLLNKMTKPILKWVGGKTQIMSQVLKRFPKMIRNYFEPFVGGGSVLFSVLTQCAKGNIVIREKIYAGDINGKLIHLYKNIQRNPEEVIQHLRELQEQLTRCSNLSCNRNAATIEQALENPESYYYWIRSQFNKLTYNEQISPQGSAMFIFLNKTCFRGVYREGPNGFNVPFGHYKTTTVLDEEHIRQVSILIQNVCFIHTSFENMLEDVGKEDFVYLDPPYAPETQTSFVSYNREGFTLEKHRLLFGICHQFKENKIKFLLSNSHVELVCKAFPANEFTTNIVECRRAIHSKDPSAKTNEVLIYN